MDGRVAWLISLLLPGSPGLAPSNGGFFEVESMETVVIKTVNGPVIINKSDFDQEKHELYVEEKQEEQKPVRKYARKSKD